MMLTQLADEGEERWPEIWSQSQSRIRILMLCRRKERQLLEVHGDLIDHDHPAFGIFYRPRETSELIKEQGFDPRSASFQILDIATTDLGKWVQHLITNEKWVRSMTEILPIPMNLRVGLTRSFEGYSIPCFRHPDLPKLERLHLPIPAESIVGKAYVSIPRLSAVDVASRHGAEILAKAGTQSIQSEVEIPTKEVESVPIPITQPKVPLSTDPIVEVASHSTPSDSIQVAEENTTIPNVNDTPNSRQHDISEMSNALSALADGQDNDETNDETTLIDGFSEELLASVTHSAGENDGEKSPSATPSITPNDDASATQEQAEITVEASEVSLPEDAETPEINLVFPEFDSDFKGSDHSNNSPSAPSGPPSAPPSGPPSPPPTGPPSAPPSGPPSAPPSGPPSPPPTGPPSAPPTGPPSPPPTGPPSPPPTGPPSPPPSAPQTFAETPEGDFRKVVSNLLNDGIPASEITDQAEFHSVSEVATASGVDTWSIFLELTGAT